MNSSQLSLLNQRWMRGLQRLSCGSATPAGKDHPAVEEIRPLTYLASPIESVWPLTDNSKPMDNAERRRPADEVACATLMRAVHSRWQLREVMAGFWHDHFNVDSYSSDLLAVALPSYDRTVRAHLFGNFREFLEAVATSTSMQFYLSNHSSRAGSANENYARELFELHTLGAEAYLNDRYSKWRTVPGALEGRPDGYIDQDVYEAARALTGWTIENGGGIDGGRRLPRTGKFTYVESWHDGYQKRVLATEFDAFRPPLADGRQVLDLVADHPATARHLAGKLVRRLVGDEPQPRLVKAAADVWMTNRRAPDQIARVLRIILLSPEFAQARGTKVKRPFGVVVSFARQAGIADFVSSDPLQGELGNAGQRLFAFGAPNGLPDERATFLSSSGMQKRWTLVMALAQNWWGTGEFKPGSQFGYLPGGVPTAREAVRHWLVRFGGQSDAATEEALLGGIGWPPDEKLKRDGDYEKRLATLAAYAAMAPSFQVA